jgi:putative endonuclease
VFFCFQKGYNEAMAISKKRSFGDIGEKAAAKYLKNKGYEIIEKNYKNTTGRMLGEIDIIAKDNDAIVFVEVKTREMQKYKDTSPEENISYLKLKRMARIGDIYLRQKGLNNASFRFDAISIWLDIEHKKAKIKHILSL